MALVRLLYVSSAAPNLQQADHEAILVSARRHNLANGITGALFCGRSAFLQVIEGEQKAIEATLARIRRDPRHSGVVVVSFGVATKRSFPRWLMGLVDRDAVSKEVDNLVNLAFGGFEEAVPDHLPADLLAILENFYRANIGSLPARDVKSA